MRFSLLFFLLFLGVLSLTLAQGNCPVYSLCITQIVYGINKMLNFTLNGFYMHLCMQISCRYLSCNWLVFISFGKYLQDFLFGDYALLPEFTRSLVHLINTAGACRKYFKDRCSISELLEGVCKSNIPTQVISDTCYKHDHSERDRTFIYHTSFPQKKKGW